MSRPLTGPMGTVVGNLLGAIQYPSDIPNLAHTLPAILRQIKNSSHQAFLQQKLQAVVAAQHSKKDLGKIRDEVVEWLRHNTFVIAGEKVVLRNVPSSGTWKDGGDGTKFRTGFDGSDGSLRIERLIPTPDGSHYHEILKVSTDGKILVIHTADKNKR